MTAPLVVGLDLSMTATGIAHGTGYGETVVSNPAASLGDQRLWVHAIAIRSIARGAALAVIEDVPPAQAQAIKVLSMVHGAARVALLSIRVPYALIPPSTLKLYATGRGNASKDDMAEAAARRAGGIKFRTSDECDAWWLRAAGLWRLGYPIVTVPAEQCAALVKVRWPRRPPHEELETR